MKEIGRNKALLTYIVAYFFYIDGVHTVISMATTYGTNLGLDSTGMLLALLLVQVPALLPFVHEAQRQIRRAGHGGVGICVYMFICVFGFFMRSPVAVLAAGGIVRHSPGRHPGAVPQHVRQS